MAVWRFVERSRLDKNQYVSRKKFVLFRWPLNRATFYDKRFFFRSDKVIPLYEERLHHRVHKKKIICWLATHFVAKWAQFQPYRGTGVVCLGIQWNRPFFNSTAWRKEKNSLRPDFTFPGRILIPFLCQILAQPDSHSVFNFLHATLYAIAIDWCS